MVLFLVSKTHRNWPINCKKQTMHEKHNYTCFWSKRYSTFHNLEKIPKTISFSSFLDPWLYKILQQYRLNLFSSVILLLLTLRSRTSVWNSKRNGCNFAVLVLVHSNARNLPLFNQKLMEKRMSWLLACKTYRK